MVNAPTAYNPRTYPTRSLERRNLVIEQMVRNNYISASQALDIKTNPIHLNYEKLDETAGLAPYFRMVLGEELKNGVKRILKVMEQIMTSTATD